MANGVGALPEELLQEDQKVVAEEERTAKAVIV